MNVLLPGGIEASVWAFLGPYNMFNFVITALAALALAIYLYFKKGF